MLYNLEWLNKSKEELRNEILQFIINEFSYAEQINMFVIVGDTMLFDKIFEGIKKITKHK